MKKLKVISESFLDFCFASLYLLKAIFFSLFCKFDFFKKGEPLFTKQEIKEIESGQIFIQEEKKAKQLKESHGPPRLIQ